MTEKTKITAFGITDCIPFLFGIALICNKYVSFSAETGQWLQNCSVALLLPLFFMQVGFRAANICKEKDIHGKLRYGGQITLAYGIATAAYLLFTVLLGVTKKPLRMSAFFSGLVYWENNADPFNILFFVFFLSGLAALVFFYSGKSKRYFLLSGIIGFLYTLFADSYGTLLPFSVKNTLFGIFTRFHTGFFGVYLFTVLGFILAHEKEKSVRNSRLGTGIFAVCFFAEAFLVFGRNGDSHAVLLGFAAPLDYCIFRCLQRTKPLQTDRAGELVRMGFLSVFTVQFLLSAAEYTHCNNSSLFSWFFTTSAISAEFVFICGILSVAFLSALHRSSDSLSKNFTDCLQDLTVLFTKPFAWLSGFLGRKPRNIISMLSFTVVISLVWFFERLYATDTCMTVYKVCLLLILVTACEKNMKPGSIFVPGFLVLLFSGLAFSAVSVLFSVYAYRQIGQLILFFFLPLLLITGSGGMRVGQLYENFTDGIYLSYALFCLYCILLRPYDITRYKGAFCNANMCGLYLVLVFAAAVGNITDMSSRAAIKKNIRHILIAGTSFAFILFTVSRTALAGALAVLCCVWFVKRIQRSKEREPQSVRIGKAAAAAGYCAFFFVLCFSVTYLAIRFLPGRLITPAYLYTELTDDMLTPYKVMPGAPLSDDGYVSLADFFARLAGRTVGNLESLNDASTGRIDIYLTFLKNLSLFGHTDEKLLISSTSEYMIAHNAFLQIAYNLGIPVGILFICCIGLICIHNIKRLRTGTEQKTKYAFLLTVCAFTVCGMFESVDSFYYPILFGLLSALSLSCVEQTETAALPDCTDTSAVLPGSGSDRRLFFRIIMIFLLLLGVVVFIKCVSDAAGMTTHSGMAELLGT